MTDEKGDYEVGYGKPPKGSRFASGQSGNPAGRPKRTARSKSTDDPRLDATRRALRERAERLVTILENGKRKQVTTIEAVFGALTNTALKGGVYAQRTLLEFFAKEDALYRSERQANFDYWRSERIEALVGLQTAEARGESAPNLVPHPDDIRLDYHALTVQFDGPVDEKGATETAMLRRHAMLCFELSAYWEETFEFNPDDPGCSKMGPFLAMSIILRRQLPQRMRGQTPEEREAQDLRMISRRPGGRWETYLEAECAVVGIPLIRPTGPIRFVELKEFCDTEQIREIAERQLKADKARALDEALAEAARRQLKAQSRKARRKQRSKYGSVQSAGECPSTSS